MTNAFQRANGPAMPSNRRALLHGALTVGAMAVPLGTATAGGARGIDAVLLVLLDEALILKAREDATDEIGLAAEGMCSQRRDLWRRIIDTPAVTLAGMLAKLAFAAQYFEPDEIPELDDNAYGILVSVAVDARRIVHEVASHV
jgi:hypothetical protein